VSFDFSLVAAALISASTRLRVAVFVRRFVILVNPWAFANLCISFASNSQPVSCPSQPLYCLGSTAFKPMCRDAPMGINGSFFVNWGLILNYNAPLRQGVCRLNCTGCSFAFSPVPGG